MLSNDPLFISFFDDEENNKTDFDFIKPSSNYEKNLSSSAVLASTLNCQGSHSPWTKRGIYGLHDQLIVFYNPDSANVPYAILPIALARLTMITPAKTNPNYGFRLTRNGACFDFYSPNKQTIESWTNALKPMCILSNFHEEYKAAKTLGRGGFAKVYMIESKTDKNLVYAAKAFSKAEILSSSKEKAKPALKNEIELMRSLNHDNIVKLYEVHETENSIYLVLELIKGKTLYEILKKSTLKKPLLHTEIRDMVQALISALDYIASQGIMHRDMKPSNILVEKGGKIKVADFGLATRIKAPKYIFRKCGTPGYMAPEVFRYDEKDPSTYYNDRCDMFSIGCVFFYMLFGYPFFDSYICPEVSVQNKNYDMDFEAVTVVKRELNNATGKVDKDALNLLLKLIELDPAQRITASEALLHPYLNSMLKVRKNQSSGASMQHLTHKMTQTELLVPTSPLNKNKHITANTAGSLNETSDPGSYIAICPHRFTDKDSIYLEVTKHQSLGKSDENIDNCSVNNSMRTENNNFGTSLNTISLSTFAKLGPLQKNNHRAGSHRNLTQMGSAFLKAAIHNNIQKQKAETENELPDEPIKSNRSPGRYKTEYIYVRQNTTVRDDTCEEISNTIDLADESSEIEIDIDGDLSEDTQIQNYLDHIKNLTKEKLPSLKSHTKGRLNTAVYFPTKN